MTSTQILFATLSFLVGLLIPFQSLINSKLGQTIQHPFGAAFVSFTGGFVIFLVACFIHPLGFPSVKKLTSIPWYYLTGGVIGAGFILTAIFVVPRLGSTAWIALIVTGQLVMSLIVDHFGMMGVPVEPVSLPRVFGAILLLGGTFLLIR